MTDALKLPMGQGTLVLTFGAPAAVAIVSDFAPYTVAELSAFTVKSLGDGGSRLILTMQGGTMPLQMGVASQSTIGQLAPYTILALDPYSIAELDSL